MTEQSRGAADLPGDGLSVGGDLPSPVVAALSGDATVGEWEPAHLLVTVNDEGVPDVCLLSRTELTTAGGRLRVVVASRKGRANLARTPTATLIAWADGLYYLAARVMRQVEVDGAAGYELAVTRVLHDDVGVALEPMRFRVEPWLSAAERWDRTVAAFELLEASASASGGTSSAAPADALPAGDGQ